MNRLCHNNPLARDLLDHLRHELLTLDQQREALNVVHAALLGHDAAPFEQAVAHQAQVAADAADQTAVRHAMLTRLANALRLEFQQVTLTQLLTRSELNLQSELAELQRQIREAAEEVLYLQRRNLLVIQRSADWFRHLVFQLTGQPEGVQCYTASGQLESAGGAVLMEADC